MSDPRTDDELLIEAVGPGAKRLRTRGYDHTLVGPGEPADVAQAVGSVLEAEGRLIDADGRSFRGIVGGGVLGLNQAVVRATVRSAGGDKTAVELTAVAKEGLIPQRTARKALARVIGALALGPAEAGR